MYYHNLICRFSPIDRKVPICQSSNKFVDKKNRRLGFVTLNRNLDVKGWMGLAYDYQVHDKKSFNINLLHLLYLLIYSLNILFFYSITFTHRIKSYKIFKNLP